MSNFWFFMACWFGSLGIMCLLGLLHAAYHNFDRWMASYESWAARLRPTMAERKLITYRKNLDALAPLPPTWPERKPR